MDTALPARPPVVEVLTSAIERDSRVLLAELMRCRGKLRTKSVHTVRTTIRRLLAALELADALGSEPKARVVRGLNKLLSALSPLRDCQVQLRTLARMSDDAVDLSALSARLRSQKRGRARKARRRLVDFDAQSFQRDIAAMVEQLGLGATRDRDAALTAVQGDLARRHLQVARQRARVSPDDPRALHQLRLSLKSYGYRLAALDPALPIAARRLSEAVKHLQDQLGEAHDAHVLAKSVKSVRKTDRTQQTKRLSRDLEHVGRNAQRAAAEAVKTAALDWPFASDATC
jgi:CHAD domain-containing protein